MAKNILVATPQPAFGELLRLSLEESGRYRVRLVQTGREALSSAEHILFSLAILDSALVEPPFRYVTQGLRKHIPELRLLVIPPPEGSTSPEVTDVQPDGCVSQPFYAPSLLETIDSLTNEAISPPPPAAPVPVEPGPLILQDAALATQHLEEFLKDSSAPGVLLLRMQQPWAAAGQLNREALNEVAGLLARYSKANEGVDLARYVHLKSDGGEYLIYATPVNDSQVLTMIYQVTTPLTVIRAQAGRLARLLRQAGERSAVPVVDLPPPTAPPPAASPPLDSPPVLPPQPKEDEADNLMEAEAMRLADLLAEMPEPNPAARLKAEPGDWVQAVPPASPEEAGFLFPWELKDTTAPTQAILIPTGPAPEKITTPAEPPPAAPGPAPIAAQPARPLAAEPPLQPNLSETMPTPLPASTPAQFTVPGAAYPAKNGGAVPIQDPQVERTYRDSTSPTIAIQPVPVAQPGVPPAWPPAQPAASIEQTRPVLVRSLAALQAVEPAAPTLAHLAYTCVLLPRLPAHALDGFLAERLNDWLPQLCLAYGWRLEGLLIRPGFLQWTVQVAPANSPGNVVRLIRQQTTRRVFSQFPQLEVENPSGDFWAPGYLIISGFQPPSLHLVQDFIRQTRLRQGPWL